jgi:hypothetical protein
MRDARPGARPPPRPAGALWLVRHSHLVILVAAVEDDESGPEMDQPTFHVIGPTPAFLQDPRPAGARTWTWAHGITLAPGARLGYLRAGGYADPCSSTYMDWDEFAVLKGPWAGRVVLVEDAGTVRDERGSGSHLGWRPRLGPPPTVVADHPLPPDWCWAVVV